jgi:transposase-like protein
MPKPTPLGTSLRNLIGNEIAMGTGRNELARKHGVSPGIVSKIARERGLGFRNVNMTALATHARQVDQWAARMDREDELLDQYLALTDTQHGTRAETRLIYALYDVRRHHNGTYE